MKILVTGGAGYIGSHIVNMAKLKNFDVTILDNFSTGNISFVKDCEILNIDLLDSNNVERLFNKRKFDYVIHLAAKSDVAESIINPKFYYMNNVVGSLNLVNSMIKNDMNDIIFSSSAAIYGNPDTSKVLENSKKNPINPYGSSKLIVERFLKNLTDSYSFNSLSLRYFNVGGANILDKIGELRNKENHVIPILLKSILSNNKKFKINGDKYKTKDGTCIRDYIHVDDLVDAHFKGICYLNKSRRFQEINLGSGLGFSIYEIIDSAKRVTKTNVNSTVVQPRRGDPDMLVADIQRAKNELDWAPKKDIDSIISSSWEWIKFCSNIN